MMYVGTTRATIGDDQDQPRQLLRGFPARPDDPPRDAAHGDGGRRRALHRRSTARASRCSPRTPSRRRSAIRARRSTTCSCSTSCSARPCRTSRSTPSPISATPTAASSRRSIPGDTLHRGVRGDRAEGELQPQDRHRLCALDRLQPGRQRGARLCALGDGAEARRGGAGARRARAAAAGGGAAERRSAMPARRSTRGLRLRARRQRRTASATTRSARRSTTSTA